MTVEHKIWSFDLDGTLGISVCNDEGSSDLAILRTTTETIKALVEAGHTVVINTGRMYEELDDLVALWPKQLHWLTELGSVYHDPSGDGFVISSVLYVDSQDLSGFEDAIADVDTLTSTSSSGATLIVKCLDVAADYRNRALERMGFYRWEFNCPGEVTYTYNVSDKAVGLDKLFELNIINSDLEVIHYGDERSDIPMTSHGQFVTVNTASKEVQDAADVVCHNDPLWVAKDIFEILTKGD